MTKYFFRFRALFFPSGVILPMVFAFAISARASVVWNGPLLTYNQPAPDPGQATNQDRITPDVWLTRTNSGGLFNAAAESAPGNGSPAKTEWAFGALTNYATLPYTNWLAWLSGKSPTTMVGSNVVVHLIPEDLYLSFKFSFWAAKGAGGFTYQRSTPVLPWLFDSPTNTNTGGLGFSYTTFPALAYVVQSSTNLVDWSPVTTNNAGGTLSSFSSPASPAPAFFRVVQMEGP